MVTTVPRGPVHGRITAPQEPRVVQEKRGHLFVTIYLGLALLATLGFAALVLLVRDTDVLLTIDRPITQAIQSVQLPGASWILAHGGDLGWPPYNYGVVALIAVALVALRLRLEAVVIVASTLLAGGADVLAKDFVQRARPSGAFVHVAAHLRDFSFPSGHVVFYTVLCGVTFWVVWIAWANSLARNVALVALALLIAVVGPSRIFLGQHWPSDVLGAYCLASLWVAGTIELLLVLKPRVPAWWSGRPHRRQWRSA